MISEPPDSIASQAMTHLKRWRWVRFAIVGATAAVVQLELLREMTALGVLPLAANALAFIAAAQLNFLLSLIFTWGDRVRALALGESLAGRWARFHASIAGTALLNMLVFAAARQVVPDVAASAIGIGSAGLANYLLGDRLVFDINWMAHADVTQADQRVGAGTRRRA